MAHALLGGGGIDPVARAGVCAGPSGVVILRRTHKFKGQEPMAGQVGLASVIAVLKSRRDWGNHTPAVPRSKGSRLRDTGMSRIIREMLFPIPLQSFP